jgi:hypothetical protein
MGKLKIFILLLIIFGGFVKILYSENFNEIYEQKEWTIPENEIDRYVFSLQSF